MCTKKNKSDKLMETRLNILFLPRLINVEEQNQHQEYCLIHPILFHALSNYNKHKDEQISPVVWIITFKHIRCLRKDTFCSTCERLFFHSFVRKKTSSLFRVHFLLFSMKLMMTAQFTYNYYK